MAINGYVHKTPTWIGGTSVSTGKGAHPHGQKVKIVPCPKTAPIAFVALRH